MLKRFGVGVDENSQMQALDPSCNLGGRMRPGGYEAFCVP
jgi:hypothetical protein